MENVVKNKKKREEEDKKKAKCSQIHTASLFLWTVCEMFCLMLEFK